MIDGYLHLQGLFLGDWNLYGYLPQSIEVFTQLRQLNLSENTLTGTLPWELGTLQQLQTLDISNNELTGTLPTELCQLQNLTGLYLYDTQLSGPIPLELGNLSKLQDLLLYDCYFTGPIPPQLGYLGQLTQLYLNVNELSGTMPPELGNLQFLAELNVATNYLSYVLPNDLGNLTSLILMDISSNFLSGTLPLELGNLVQLTQLQVFVNSFTGSLPAQLGNLTQLTVFSGSDNILSGDLPSEFGNLLQLQVLDLTDNYLSGALPSQLGNLAQLQTLTVGNNFLFGYLPESLGALHLLTVLALYENDLTGTIPAQLGELAHLTVLELNINELTGSIPPAICNLDQLLELDVSYNQLTGVLPSTIGNLQQLEQLVLTSNDGLSGTLPPQLGALRNLTEIYLGSNAFSGTIPPELGNLTLLTVLNLENNMLTGQVPDELGSLSELRYLVLGYNTLTGSLPETVYDLAQLLMLTLSDNRLTGTLSGNFENIAHLDALEIDNNAFSGTIPEALYGLPALQIINLNDNRLSGTLSTALSSMQRLVFFSVVNNRLGGCLPSLSAIASLQEVDVTHNRLLCSLDTAFDSNQMLHSQLINVQLGHNEFTGTLPTALFQAPKLQTLVAYSNCLSGTLQDDICEAGELQSLILDGMGSSRSCLTMWSTWYREGSLRIPNRVHGTIPECVFTMPLLTTLHLSGNNLDGTIAGNVALNRHLTSLYLSHNLLSGTIPAAIQTHTWEQLDVSYNRFTGSLLPSFGEGCLDVISCSIVVNNSRLSGNIPDTALELGQVSILGTNMFCCKADKSDVPNTDGNGDKQKYQCGSDSFNYSYYIFLGCAGVAVAIMIVLLRCGSSSMGYVASYFHLWNLSQSSLPPSCRDTMAMVTVVCKIAVVCTAVALVVLVPWYSAASHYYGTYTHQYAWVVSAAFLSGLAPGLVQFFLWSGVIIVVAVTLLYLARTEKSIAAVAQTDGQQNEDIVPTAIAPRVQAYGIFLLVNVVVTVGVNVAFVYISLNEDAQAVLLAQVALSLWKFFWNTACVPYLIDLISERLMHARRSNGFFQLQVFIGLFNNIAIPCLVVAAQSSSCFRDILFPPGAIEGNYAAQTCIIEQMSDDAFEVECSDSIDEAEQFTFTPQFSYSYQCSSSFITYYSAAMVYFALTAAVLVPAMRLLLSWLLHVSPPTSVLHRLVDATLPRLWKVPATQNDLPAATTTTGRAHYVNVHTLMVSLAVYMGILLSFGVVFPPVALAMCVAMLSTAYQTRLAVGRLLCNAGEVGAQNVVEAVERDCRGQASTEKLKSVTALSIVFAICFYALFVFDTIGDAQGFAPACWALILGFLAPVLAIAYGLYRRPVLAQVGRRQEVSPAAVEMGAYAGSKSEEGRDAGGATTQSVLHSERSV